MRNNDLFKAYIWLVEKLRNQPEGMTLEEIGDAFSNSNLGFELRQEGFAKPTFYRYRQGIAEIFGIEIKNRALGNRYVYYIDNTSGGGLPQWITDMLATTNVLVRHPNLCGRLLMERVPVEGQRLEKITAAMEGNRCLRVTYQRFGAKAKSYTVEPLCLKLWNRRWYVLVRIVRWDVWRVLALDRIVALDITEETFTLPRNFNAEQVFADHYGVSINEGEAEDIVLRADSEEADYIRTLPIHPSQRELETDGDYTFFCLHLSPSWEFQAFILSRGANVKVISPQWLADNLCLESLHILDLYPSDEEETTEEATEEQEED